tara:strand:+ start:290 stop:958 length:669 start_codon:yes stop_codon:yes gene_type:complete
VPKTYFITGTDTDVGKTFVSCNLLQAAKLKGLSTAAIKPIAAGGVISNEELQNEDALLLQKNCTLGLSYKEINPFCLKQAIAPHIAAQNEGVSLKASELAGHCNNIMSKKADLTLIEGAGGWQVPLNQDEFIGDIVKILNIPVILVVGIKLGCLNHALLTAKALRKDGVVLHGWIANQIDPLMPAYEKNIESLIEKIEAPLLANIPWAFDTKSRIVPIECIL